MRSAIIETGDRCGKPIQANASETLSRVATAPELTRRQIWALTGAHILMTMLTWAAWRLVMGSQMSFWYEAIGNTVMFYHWIMYWRTFEKMRKEREFLLSVIARNNIVDGKNHVERYVEDACISAEVSMLECCYAWVALALVARILDGAKASRLVIVYAAMAVTSLFLAYFGRMWVIKKFQKL